MHFHSAVLSALIAASSSVVVSAFDDIVLPSGEIKAGQEFDITIVNDLRTSDSFDAGFDSFRVYLAMTIPGWGSGPSCYLVNSTSISTTKVSVTIPASVGESGDNYMISTMEFNQGPNKDGPSGFDYSSGFTLSGGTGTWSEFELSGSSVGDPENLPCIAYDCARKCAQKHYTDAVLNDPDSRPTDKAWVEITKCTLDCPGVKDQYSPEVLDEIEHSGEDDEGSSSSTSSTGSTAAAKTFSSAMASKTAASSSAMATGTSTTNSSASSNSTTTTTTTTNGTATSTTPANATGAGGRNEVSIMALAVLGVASFMFAL